MSIIVLVIRRNDEFSERLRENGCEVINLELIRTEPVENLSELDEKLSQLDLYDGLFITSRNAAEIFIDKLHETNRNFSGKIYVLGERSRVLIEKAGLNVVFGADVNTAEELIDSFNPAEFEGKRFLFVRGNRARRTVPETLSGIANVDEVEVYRTVNADIDEELFVDVRERLAGDQIDWMCFFSPSGVERFVKLFDASDANVAVIGKTTAEAAKEANLNVQLISPKTTREDFALSLNAKEESPQG
jgi:Uroporphyrinogen-III synthase